MRTPQSDEFDGLAMKKRHAVMERDPVAVLSMLSDAGWASLTWSDRHSILLGLRALEERTKA